MLIDAWGRQVDYLRISVTERCNFRCLYCMPDKPLSWVPHDEVLRYEELFLFVRAAIDLGVKKVRITGGEPTVRGNLAAFIKMIAEYAPAVDLAMTTNGFLMGSLAAELKAAGLKRVNISLDSLRRETAGRIANRDVLSSVIAGIDASIAAGLLVKLNTVPMIGINDDEIGDLLAFGKERGALIRFIEYMSNTRANKHLRGMRSDEILERISARTLVREVEQTAIGAERLFELENGYRFGVIAPHREEFCTTCNRVRLSAQGLLVPCLYFGEAMSIKASVRSGDVAAAVETLKTVLANKREKNRFNEETSTRAFYETGG
ncbi:GTP 3',8-cyclase [Campylobacterota bacterium]|nr:GTP 3',8-cyclase [Campylobacterota bacterium]